MLDREKMQADGANEVCAFLGKGSRITGKLAFDGPGRIEGHVEGEVSAQGSLVIGETGVVHARVDGGSIIVHGTVTGDVVARTRLELRAPSRVTGNVTTPSLVVHEGAILDGQCAMGASSAATDPDQKAAAERPQLKAVAEATR